MDRLIPWIRGGLSDPLGAHEAGEIVAVNVSINRKAWYMGDPEPLNTTMVLRSAGFSKEMTDTRRQCRYGWMSIYSVSTPA